MANPTRVLIYGAGALGQAVGCMLSAAGHEVALLLRQRFLQPIAERGLRVTGVLGDFHGPAADLELLTSLDQARGEYDYALITTKSYDTKKAVEDLGSIEQRLGVVVSMQNGCGNVELVSKRFGFQKSLGARVITGFEITETATVHVSVIADAIHIGGSESGKLHPAAVILAELLSAAGHDCLAVEDIHQSLFAKLLYNCALNPLGAIEEVHYGALSDHPATCRVMDAVMAETFAVIEGLGGELPWENVAAYRDYFYSTLIPATYNHRPSMLQDLENNKPTEVEALVGYVARMAEELDIPAPACSLLADLVRFKEKQTAP